MKFVAFEASQHDDDGAPATLFPSPARGHENKGGDDNPDENPCGPTLHRQLADHSTSPQKQFQSQTPSPPSHLNELAPSASTPSLKPNLNDPSKYPATDKLKKYTLMTKERYKALTKHQRREFHAAINAKMKENFQWAEEHMAWEQQQQLRRRKRVKEGVREECPEFVFPGPATDVPPRTPSPPSLELQQGIREGVIESEAGREESSERKDKKGKNRNRLRVKIPPNAHPNYGYRLQAPKIAVWGPVDEEEDIGGPGPVIYGDEGVKEDKNGVTVGEDANPRNKTVEVVAGLGGETSHWNQSMMEQGNNEENGGDVGCGCKCVVM